MEQGHRATICSPSVIFKTHCSAAVGTSRALISSCLSQGGSSSAFDFSLHLRCPTSSRWPSAPHLPSASRPSCPLPCGMPTGGARVEWARRDSLLVWKTSHVQAEFILGYSTGATIQHDRAERSLRWGEHRRSGAKQAQLGTVLGPLRRSPGRAKQSRHSTGLEELSGRGRHCPRKTASCTYTAAARAANKAAESLRTAALCSCHRSTGSGCRENKKTTATTT